MKNMSKVKITSICPCGSKQSYSTCCGRYHLGSDIPTTAEALMRSRYSAYVLLLEDYLLASWHPDTRPTSLDLKKETTSTQWIGLSVIKTEAGLQDDTEGTVEFVARYKVNGRAGKLTEKSRFIKIEDRWYYLDGV